MRHVPKWWDWIVAYLIPGPVYRVWSRWIWAPIRYRAFPWTPSACDYCPICRKAQGEYRMEHP